MKNQNQIVQAMKCCLTNGKFALLLFSSILLFSSCGNNLSRGKAEKILREQFPWVNLADVRRANLDIKDEAKLDKAFNDKLIVFFFGYNPGKNGLKYVYKKWGEEWVVTHCNEFNEITGIKMQADNKSAIVEYTTKVKSVTPYGEVYGYKIGDINKFNMKFNLYDDGWRAEIKYHVNPSEFDFMTADGNMN